MDITKLREQFPNPIRSQDNHNIEPDKDSMAGMNYCVGGALCLYFDFEEDAFEDGGAFPSEPFLSMLLHNEFGLKYWIEDRDTYESSSRCSDSVDNQFSRCKNTQCFTANPEECVKNIAFQITGLNDAGEFEEVWAIIENLSQVNEVD